MSREDGSRFLETPGSSTMSPLSRARCAAFFLCTPVLSLAAQQAFPAPCGLIESSFPNTGAFVTLRAQSVNNPNGMPPAPAGRPNYTPIAVSIGDIDNDGQPDLLFQAEQRLLMAVKVMNAAGTMLAQPSVLWVHFDACGDLYKHDWGTDSAAIADFDGDGRNEVAAVIGHAGGCAGSGSSRLVIIETGAGAADPIFGEPTPIIGATVDVDTFATAWTFHANNTGGGAGGSNFVVQSARVRGGTATDDVYLFGTQAGRMALAEYAVGALNAFFQRGSSGAATHYPQHVDVNGDGHEDILENGVIDVWNNCSWDFRTSISFLTNHTGNYNHADTVMPYYPAGNTGAAPLLLILHDGYDLLTTAGGTGCAPAKIWENTRKNDLTEAIYHGQQAVSARLIDGPDAFGFDGYHYVAAAKGPPLYFAGTVTVNARGQELVIANNNGTPLPVGPRGGLLQVIDWDGGTTDEVLSFSHNRYSVWRLRFDGSDPALPYVWNEVFGHDRPTGVGSISAFGATTADFFAGGRDEIVVFGRRGLQVVWKCP